MALRRLSRVLGHLHGGGVLPACNAANLCLEPDTSLGGQAISWRQVRSVQTGLPLDTGRPRLVILGTGWAAARLARDIDPRLYDLTVRALLM